MQRKIISKLKQWKAGARRKPLLVRGARQVGKTYTIMEFGQIHFNGNIHVFNFEKNPEIHSIFEQNLASNRIISELELVVNKKIVPGKDLLFLMKFKSVQKQLWHYYIFMRKIRNCTLLLQAHYWNLH